MKKFILILILIILTILDNSLMPFLSIKGAYPSLLFVFVIAYSIINGRKEAVLVGVISGLLQDVYLYEGFGVNSLVNMLVCLVAAIIGENIYKDKRLIPTISTIVLYIIKMLLVFFIFKLDGRSIDFRIGIYSSIYSTLIMFLGYNFVLRLYDNKFQEESWRFK